MDCPRCFTMNAAQARFCSQCGYSLVKSLICRHCYSLIAPHDRYCSHCGNRVIENINTGHMPSLATLEVESLTPQQVEFHSFDPLMETRETLPISPALTMETSPVRVTSEQPLTAVRTIQQMLPSLHSYLPPQLYEPLERRPTDKHLEEVRDHLQLLLKTVRTYVPTPVYEFPQPAGEPKGGIYRGVFLFGDVAGFTPLSEQLRKLGQIGAERITEITNDLFSALVKILVEYGGTLLKFGGDALLGVFPAESDKEMAENAFRASQAAMAMLAAMSQFEAIEAAGEVRSLRIKCGISAGSYFAAHIGNKTNMAYVTTGHTVNQAEQAEGYAEAGEAAMTGAAYALVKDKIEAQPLEDNYYLIQRVPSVEGGLRPIQEEILPPGTLTAQISYLVTHMERLAPYLSDELIERIVNNPDDIQIQPEHRPVTVMFVNYLGIGELIEDMGETQPEVITHHLNNYFVHMAEIVERYEGTLARMDQYAVGDRLLIFFGAPLAHEDDPVRAVYTALEMQQTVREEFSALQTPQKIYRFRQRIGINAGSLFAGNVGARDLRQEYKLMGDDINLAARLMSKAGWEQIVISQKTQERVAPFFELKDHGELEYEGESIKVRAFEVIARSKEVELTGDLDNLGENPGLPDL